MSKRKRAQSSSKKIKNGQGQGFGIEYTPWIKIQDVASLGRVTRLKGLKIPRQYEFLSDLETNYFYIVEYSDKVIDIREQYPLLPVEETVVIAKELGIKHPYDVVSGEPYVLSSDFLITIKNGSEPKYLARTCKYKSDLAEEDVLEKFEIERVYWERKGIDWGIVTELEVSKEMAHNISFVYGYSDLSVIEGYENVTEYELEEMSIYFINKLLSKNQTVKQIDKDFNRDFGMQSGCGLSLFKHLVITKTIELDLSVKLDMSKVQHIKNVRKDYSERVDVV